MIKKVWFIIIFIIPLVYAINYPILTKYVTDQADILSNEEEQKLNERAKQIEEQTTAEIAIVTINSLEGISKEQYATELFEKAGIGKKEKDNGLLILIAKEEREYRVEVGYGLEEFIPDSSKIIIGTQILEPYFKQDKFGEGIYNALDTIQIMITGQEYTEKESDTSSTWSLIKIVLIIFFFILIIIAQSRRRGLVFIPGSSGHRGRGRFGSGGFGSSGGFGGGRSGGGGFGGKF